MHQADTGAGARRKVARKISKPTSVQAKPAQAQYLNETVVPIWALRETGYEIVLATPDGTKPHSRTPK